MNYETARTIWKTTGYVRGSRLLSAYNDARRAGMDEFAAVEHVNRLLDTPPSDHAAKARAEADVRKLENGE